MGYVLKAVLSSAQHPEYGQITVPFPIPDEKYDRMIELLEPLEIGDALRQDCRVDELDSFYTVLNRLVGSLVNFDELDYLAKRLDSFDDGEAAQFQGMACKLGVSNIKDFINLTFCCQQATVITDFSDLDAIGRQHYMTMQGGGCRIEELERLDGRKFALDLILNHLEGRITPYGVVYAAYELGKMYRDGIGCEKDAEASEQWYRQAFAGFLELEQQSHDDKLQYRIGWMLLHGVGTGKDETAAREWFEQASKLDNPHAQYQLARMIFNDPSSTPEQTAQALERLTKAAEAGQDCAQYALGKIYRDGQGVEKDIQKAVALFTLAATKENSFAAFALGKLYLAGDAALPRDPAAALKWLTYAAELGNQFAQYRLGKLLLKGDDGIPKDVITAIRWLTAAAKQENGYAEYVLALVYLTGEDAPKDSVKALSLLKRSAGRGNQFAQYRLGKLLLQGEDAPKDVKAAIRWLTAAAEQGNQYAQYALGKLYLLGKEVPKDRSSAIKWFQLAADQGNEYAQYFLKHMDDRLGQPPVAAVISLFHHLANIFQEQNQPPPSGGVRVAVDRKLLRKIKAKKIAQGHKADDHEPEMQL